MVDILTVRDLRVGFHIHGTVVTAVDGVSFCVRQGTTMALVGESGSGKSTVAQSIMGILPKVGRIEHGEILYRDPAAPGGVIDIAKLDRDGRRMRAIRGGQISIIFQEPMTSLSPVHTIGNQVDEALRLHRDVGRSSRRELTIETLRMVGFPDPGSAYKAYSFELSGGLRQRAMIAMALVCRPTILIADEPTTALDVTIQAQILKLLIDLQGELGMAVLIITHDLGVVANLAEEVVVMYHGRVVESGSCDDIFNRPEHPWMQHFVELDALPMTANGKIDRNALPSPSGVTRSADRPLPQTEIEMAIGEIWRQVLGAERLSREDNFFDIGGHSLLMVRLHRLLKDRVPKPLAMTDLYRFPTIADLAEHLGGGDDSPGLVQSTDRAQKRRDMLKQRRRRTG